MVQILWHDPEREQYCSIICRLRMSWRCRFLQKASRSCRGNPSLRNNTTRHCCRFAAFVMQSHTKLNSLLLCNFSHQSCSRYKNFSETVVASKQIYYDLSKIWAESFVLLSNCYCLSGYWLSLLRLRVSKIEIEGPRWKLILDYKVQNIFTSFIEMKCVLLFTGSFSSSRSMTLEGLDRSMYSTVLRSNFEGYSCKSKLGLP